MPSTLIAALQNLPRAGKAAIPREAAGKIPVKVLILAGQSNMEGYGGINTDDELGDHPTLGELLKKVKKADGSFVECRKWQPGSRNQAPKTTNLRT